MDIAKVSWLEHYTKKMYMDDAGCDYIGEMKKKRITLSRASTGNNRRDI